ncbi:T9SS C-terminal target domain-containing protein [Riemerella anatipestifer]|uniref:T9SS type A sorting domain-containing protein n=1 Tax=Riemerella anatipestifer TaxID=34085 RepID=UPI00129E273C|nr:T9SS type A sorting domain-containing protein [Riemerella anatipestifer]MRM96813.1 T9SS C-terminal target domain-containing protein [Riemerella anatipestifer]MRM99844.1 T9SS C-terminal target domain-containing protein [Riemerella anatipestifer]MRN01794.1 T9SS C-terminal target domain-containing protein [Riemerella anatipestifer]
MKKGVFSIGLLALGVLSLKSQSLTYVGSAASVYVKPGTLMYSGGTVEVKNTGVIENQGNIKIDNGGLLTDTKTGEGFVIKQNTFTVANDPYGNYGQLWINNDNQGNITGVVKKEFQTTDNGHYQQLALPFENKVFNDLSSGLGKTFSTSRWSKNEILVYNNTLVRSEHVTDLSSQNSGMNSTSGNYRSAYYMLGADGTSFTTVRTVTGTPFASATSMHTVSLQNAGNGIDFGVGGNGLNMYREKYNTYMYDSFYSYPAAWEGTYGRNIYQFGNPFLTNLDLTKIPTDLQSKIQAIRVEVKSVAYNSTSGTSYSGYKYISFTRGGAVVGDIDLAIVRPMGTFVIKMKDGETGSLDLATLRTFENRASMSTQQGEGTMSLATNAGNLRVQNNSFKSLTANTSNSVKQLGVIALDNEGNEIGRTYYAVYPSARTGTGITSSTQVTATSSDVIGTFEENPAGGYDQEAASAYWLYINEANETDYKGKDILLGLYSDKIKKVKFEIRENTEFLPKNTETLSSGESFYISSGEGNLVALQQGAEYPVSQQYYNLYYGKPENKTLAVADVQKPSDCMVVYDKNIKAHRLIFDSKWVEADVKVYDVSGRLVISESTVKTDSDFVINLPETQATYVVTAVSKDGQKFSQKIVK